MSEYRGGIGGNTPAGPRGTRRRPRMTFDRKLSLVAIALGLVNIAWEVAR